MAISALTTTNKDQIELFNDTCTICMDPLEKAQEIIVCNGNHALHVDCANGMIDSGANVKCPTCEAGLTNYNGKYTFVKMGDNNKAFIIHDSSELQSHVHTQRLSDKKKYADYTATQSHTSSEKTAIKCWVVFLFVFPGISQLISPFLAHTFLHDQNPTGFSENTILALTCLSIVGIFYVIGYLAHKHFNEKQ